MHLTVVNPAYCGAKLFPTSCRENLTQKLFRVMRSNLKVRSHRTSKQFLLAMKITAIFLFVASLHLSAKTLGQQVTLSVKDASLKTVFLELNRQTGFNFLYSDEALSKAAPVTLKVQNELLEKVLALCFKDQPLSYTIENNSIVVNPKASPGINPSYPPTGVNTPNAPPPIDVRGRVVNESGESVAGATVTVKGTRNTTATNENGDFVLTNVDEKATILITGVNIHSLEIKVSGKTDLSTITVKNQVTPLEEIITKGYYNTSKRLNTGSVVKINGSQISNQPISNPILGLKGLVPGLLITQNNGLPGSRFNILIRGKNSIQNGNGPLFVVDGVPFLSNNDALTQLNGMLANSPFNTLDPNNIESIEILKDADATAIYGSRGANGVILITTKKSKDAKNSLSLNISKGWGKVTRTMDLMNTQQYLEMRKEAFLNDGMTPDIYNAPDLVSWDQSRYTDWKKLFIGGTAQTYNAQLRYTGGNEFTKFSVGTGYYNETTVFPGESGDKKATADINIQHKSNDNKLNLNFISSYSSDKSILPGQDLTTYTNLPPNSYPLIDKNGMLVWQEAGYSVGNPLAFLKQKNDIGTDRLTANGIISFHPNNSFEIKTSFGYNTVGVNQKTLSPMTSLDPAYAPTGSSVFGDNNIKTWIIEPQVSYKFNLNSNFRIETLIGSTFQRTQSERKLIIGNGYLNDELLGSIAAAPSISVSNSNAQYNYAAVFGRVGMDYKNKYLLNITGRRDGSSRFGPDKQFADFGAVGGAWIFSKEPIVQKAIPFLSFGKFRGSYGLTGNDQIGNYQYFDTYTGTTFPYDGQPGLTPSRLFNPNYSWEINKKTELAVELGFLQDKLSINVNYYKNKSDNQIIRYSLPTQTGFSNVLLNFPGVVQNKGYEISVNAEIIKNRDFNWNTTFNISHNENKLVSFPGLANSSYSSSYVIGKPLNAFLGLHFLGIDTQTGVYKFDDSNKDGTIDNSDYNYLGTTDPKFFGGLSNSFTYKSFQLNILMEFRKQIGHNPIYSSAAFGTIQNQSIYALNRWQKPGDITPYERFTQDFRNPAYYPATYNMVSSDAALTDASFIRFKNIAFSYNVPSTWLTKWRIVKWELFCRAQNLITVTKYKGNDPENQSISSLPPLRIFTLGTQITF